MNDFQLKLILSLLGGVVFSFVFILLAFALPLDKKSQANVNLKTLKGMLEKVSHSARKKR